MVSPIENRALLTGRVLGRAAHPTVGRWDVLRVWVEEVTDVAGLPNLLAETTGTEIEVNVERDRLPEGALDGRRLHGPVRLAGPETVLALPAAAGAGPLELDAPGHEDEGPRPVL